MILVVKAMVPSNLILLMMVPRPHLKDARFSRSAIVKELLNQNNRICRSLSVRSRGHFSGVTTYQTFFLLVGSSEHVFCG